MAMGGSKSYLPQPFIFLIYVLLIIQLLLTPSVYPESFSFPSFDQNNHDITYEGDAFPSSGTIKLTTARNDSYLDWSSGRATYIKPVHLGNKSKGTLIDFTSNFSFFITIKNENSSADGLAFFMAANGSMPSNSAAACIGYINCDNKFNSSESPVVTVEFDNYKNDWDPNYDHVGININSIMSVATETWKSESVNAMVRYDSRSKNLTIFITYDDVPDYVGNLFHVVDLREYLPEWVFVGFSASTGIQSQKHTIVSWDFNSTVVEDKPNGPETNSGKLKLIIVIPIVTVVGLIIIICVIFLVILFKRCIRKKQNNRVENKREPTGSQGNDNMSTNEMVNTGEQSVNQRSEGASTNDDAPIEDKFGKYGPKRFSFQELAKATDNFSTESMIGGGGFGKVYKGFLREQNLTVAIKRFKEGSGQGIKEYEAEVNIISQLRHENLVKLFGFYDDQEQRDLILVYEFMDNGSLHDHLFKGKCPSLTWENRHSIALDLAGGLQYLHEGGKQYVVHRDIKSANVLLDSSFRAKLGDFGLARLVEQGHDPLTTYRAGTYGYLAPECAIHYQKPSKESDVYSFGIVALEIGCGKKAVEKIEGGVQELVEWVWKLYGEEKILEAADTRLCEEFDKKQMQRLLIVGLWCAHPHKLSRPSIEKALNTILDEEVELPNLPPVIPERTRADPSLHMVSESSSSANFMTPPTRFTNITNIRHGQMTGVVSYPLLEQQVFGSPNNVNTW